jgi:hypothetical protein
MFAALHNFWATYVQTSTGGIQRDLWLGAIFLVLGIVLTEFYNFARNAVRERKEAKENQHIDLTGSDWFAAWETSVDGAIVINTEALSVTQHGANVAIKNTERSPENPIGGYLWRSKLVFSHGETLMGWYYPTKEENITSRGMMYFSYDPQRKLFAGKWVGKSYDGSLCQGFVCISKDRQRSRVALSKLIELGKSHPVNVFGSVPFSG